MTVDEVLKYIEEEDGKFIRLAFRDAHGVQKNISVMPGEMKKAFEEGIPINAKEISGFGSSPDSLLYLKPDPAAITVLPWRPDSGRVLRMFCDVVTSDGTPFEADTRIILKKAEKRAAEKQVEFRFGSKAEFYLFRKDDEGNATKIPYDAAGYMDIAPLDKCENIRREISLTIEKMGLEPERSHHERGPGQNEIDFHYGKPVKAADQLTTFKMVVRTVADRNGLAADFSPVPLSGKPGNGYQIDLYVSGSENNADSDEKLAGQVLAGIREKMKEMMIFLNPTGESYAKEKRIIADGTQTGFHRQPFVCIRKSLGRVRIELRFSGALSNPYLVYALLIHAGLYGIENNLPKPGQGNIQYEDLPETIKEASEEALRSQFVHSFIPTEIIEQYAGKDSENRCRENVEK